MVNTPTWMTRREAASHARVSVQTIDNWRANGLPSTKVGRTVRINRTDLDQYLHAQQAPAA